MWSGAIVDKGLLTIQRLPEDFVITFISFPLLLLCFWVHVSLQDKRIVLKVGCSDTSLLSTSPNIFHFSFSRCCFWVVVTHGEMLAVSPRMSETSSEMISLRSVLLKYQKWACLSSWERRSFGAWRISSDCAPSHQIQSHWEVWGPSWAWVFPKILVAFEHVLSEGQKVLTPSLVFSMEGLSKCYKEIMS